jgi:ribosomal protein S18 acetylase RimI-like enzyme
MTKENIQITRYETVDDDLNSIIRLHKLISKDTNLNEHLIYFDTNFKFYFRNIITNKTTDEIYVIKIDDVLEGFIHFKLFENTLFLNNICLNNSCQGKGIGSFFLKHSLMLAYKESLINFELDVFLSNNKALKWYKKLGLKTIKKSIWMEINDNHQKLNNETSTGIYYLKDGNGFESIFFKTNKIATIINNKTILIHDLNFIDKIPNQSYIHVTNQDVNELIKKNYKCSELEISTRMKGSLKEVLHNLNQINAKYS